MSKRKSSEISKTYPSDIHDENRDYEAQMKKYKRDSLLFNNFQNYVKKNFPTPKTFFSPWDIESIVKNQHEWFYRVKFTTLYIVINTKIIKNIKKKQLQRNENNLKNKKKEKKEGKKEKLEDGEEKDEQEVEEEKECEKDEYQVEPSSEFLKKNAMSKDNASYTGRVSYHELATRIDQHNGQIKGGPEETKHFHKKSMLAFYLVFSPLRNFSTTEIVSNCFKKDNWQDRIVEAIKIAKLFGPHFKISKEFIKPGSEFYNDKIRKEIEPFLDVVDIFIKTASENI